MSSSAILWQMNPNREYGYGAGRAHPSVELVTCPHCGAPPDSLCMSASGRLILGRHFARCDAMKEFKTQEREGNVQRPRPRRTR
jgi:hypothetical protein